MSRKLSDKSLNPKKYWSILKTLNVKKVPCILYLKLRQSMSFFNSYFTGQCTPLVNNSQLPTRFTTHTNSVLTSIDFLVEQVSNIKKLDPNKAHGHGKIRIHVL